MTSSERNKARVLELIERALNGHDPTLLEQYISDPATLGSARGLLAAFPDLHIDVRWSVAEDDMVVMFHDLVGTQDGPWIFVQTPTGRTVRTSMVLAFRLDDESMIVDQWLGSNFVEMFAQLGWGFAPVGETVPDRFGS